MSSLLRATASAVSCLALGIGLSATLAAARQPPAQEPPASLSRVRDELAKPPSMLLNAKTRVDVPVATFRTQVEQRRFVLTLEEWLEKEFKLTEFQRQSAEWAAQCCGGVALANGAYGINLDPVFEKIGKMLERRKVRKIREQIARELAELEAARKKARLQDQR